MLYGSTRMATVGVRQKGDLFPVDEEGVDGDNVDNDADDLEQFERECYNDYGSEQWPSWVWLCQHHHVIDTALPAHTLPFTDIS